MVRKILSFLLLLGCLGLFFKITPSFAQLDEDLTDSPKNKSKDVLKIKIFSQNFGQDLNTKVQNVEEFNPLQPENLALKIPGLTIAKLGSLGQKTSLRYNTFTSGDLTFLFDGFEISDPSDPSEGFDISSFLLAPQFDLKISNVDNSGLSSRQLGGVVSIDPLLNSKSYIHSAAGSANQGLISVQKNKCNQSECYNWGLGGTYSEGQSAATNTLSQTALENDAASLGYLSVGWQKAFSSGSMLKLRAHSQFTQTDIDDYNENFIFADDPNAKLESSNHFLGLSYQTNSHQLFFENTLSFRNILNSSDLLNPIERDETYEVFKSKIRGSHSLTPYTSIKGLDFFWYGQNSNVFTEKVLESEDVVQTHLNRWEFGAQVDKKNAFQNFQMVHSLNYSALEGYGPGYAFSQTLSTNLISSEFLSSGLQTYIGAKERRPSFFQLFDPQFGNQNLQNEQHVFVRPKIAFEFANVRKHNISAEYFYEHINSRVSFQSLPEPKYQNSGRLNSNSLIVEYTMLMANSTFRIFYKHSFDSEMTLKSLPWLTEEELGVGGTLRARVLGRVLDLTTDIKWLFGMYNPSGKQVGNLVQSQAGLAYQFNTNDRISLQLNNLFNDKKIWDEGFQRQSFSWMLGLTKSI